MNSAHKEFSLKRRESTNKTLSVLTTTAMGRAVLVCLALSGAVWPVQSASPPILKESAKTMVGHPVSNFTLTDLAGRKVALSDFSDKKLIALFVMGNGCPVANLYLTEL